MMNGYRSPRMGPLPGAMAATINGGGGGGGGGGSDPGNDHDYWVVQKFGGTSVGKFPDKIAEDIVRASLHAGVNGIDGDSTARPRQRIAVVCSARSPGKKAGGTTSRLLEVYRKLQAVAAASGTSFGTVASGCSLASPGGSEAVSVNDPLEDAKALISDICNDHVFAARTFVRDEALRENLVGQIQDECQELVEYIVASRRFNLEVDSRSKDRVVSFGEKLSCRFMTVLLRDRGVDAEYVDLADVIHVDPESPSRLDAAFYRKAAQLFRDRILANPDRVPVVTGFFGKVPGSLIDGDIGRGYTDLCAALVAVGLGARELQVWKEVDGIFTADPTKVPTARLLASITPSEAAELTFYGSEVIHHLTMDQVISAKPPIPIRIKNVNNPRGDGTIVVPDPVLSPAQQIQPKLTVTNCRDLAARRTPKRPTAVTIKDRISVINVHSNKRSISHGFFARIFSILDRHQISVDLISTSEVHVSMAIHSSSDSVAASPDAGSGISNSNFVKAAQDLQEYGNVSILHDMAILSLVGAEMKNMIGVAGKMFSTLGDHNINIEMISQGASEINISCVIDARDATRAMNVLHTNLFTFLEDTS